MTTSPSTRDHSGVPLRFSIVLASSMSEWYVFTSLPSAPRGARRPPSQSARISAEALVTLSWASLAVRLLSQPRLTRLLGHPAEALDAPPSPPGIDAIRVGRVVERVAVRLPWRPRCLSQALATRAMLRRRGIPCVTHLGVVHTAPLSAHAWVTVTGTVVVGGPITHATRVASLG
jgi:Transglutaminase-like superfamily